MKIRESALCMVKFDHQPYLFQVTLKMQEDLLCLLGEMLHLNFRLVNLLTVLLHGLKLLHQSQVALQLLEVLEKL